MIEINQVLPGSYVDVVVGGSAANSIGSVISRIESRQSAARSLSWKSDSLDLRLRRRF